MMAVITVGAVSAFQSAIEFQTEIVPARQEQLDRFRFEEGLAQLIRAAYVSDNAQDSTTYFIAGSSSGGTGVGNAPMADTLILTVLGTPPIASFMNSQDDFETRNEVFGPQGGAAEIQISTAPVGEAGERFGLFVREQRPSDGDSFQGGYESVYDSRVSSIGFEFWNGESWQGDWDTVNQGERRLPAAVRVTYTFEGEEDAPRSFVVRIRLSDVTPENPLGVGAGGTP
jgi:hypothetical protein